MPPLRGGAVEKLWFELGKQFSRQGHTVSHISRCFPGLPDKEIIEGVQHIRVQGFENPANAIRLKALDLRYSLRALRVLPPADILVTNTFWMPILAGWRQSHWGQIMVSVERMPKGQMRFYRYASCLRSPSSAVQKAIAQEAPYFKGMIRTIPNPLPFQPLAMGDQNCKPVILYCGRLHPEKGINLLIKAFTEACQRGLKGWSLRLVGPADIEFGGGGEGWLRGLLAQVNMLGLPIEWHGPIFDNDELQHCYQQAAIFVYPSISDKGETFGLAPLEAMACGAIPIVSSLPCFQDFIVPNVNGLVFNHRATDASSQLADRILELAGNCEQRTTMSQAAMAVCQSHNPVTIATEFLQCFEQMIQTNRDM